MRAERWNRRSFCRWTGNVRKLRDKSSSWRGWRRISMRGGGKKRIFCRRKFRCWRKIKSSFRTRFRRFSWSMISISLISKEFSRSNRCRNCREIVRRERIRLDSLMKGLGGKFSRRISLRIWLINNTVIYIFIYYFYLFFYY